MTKHNIENIKEVSLFTLNESEPKALNRKIDFCKEAEIPMDIDDINEYDNDSVYVNDHNSYIHDRKQTVKEAKRGMERDVDYDVILLEKIRNRGSVAVPEACDDDLEYLGIPVPAEGR